MKTYTKEELDKILELHLKWLRGEVRGKRADFSNSDFSYANLSYVNLSDVNLSNTTLYRANLVYTNLAYADLSNANLAYTNLYNANLSRANLAYANLFTANLSNANTSGANLFHANLSNTNLSNANLGNFSIVPESGSFIVYKKLEKNVIAELYVPKSAKRIGGLLGRKCRVSKVKVKSLSIGTEAYDSYSGKLLYKVGCWVTPDLFDESLQKGCTNGIHCFITRKEAEEY